MTNAASRGRLTTGPRHHEPPGDGSVQGLAIPILPVETDHNYQSLREKYARILAPVGGLETELACQIVLAQWRLLRYRQIEAELLGYVGVGHSHKSWTFPAGDNTARHAFGSHDPARHSRAFLILNRILHRLGREYHTAMHDFLLLRQGGRPLPANSKTSAGLRRQSCCVVAIDDPPLGRKPAQPSVRPPEPLTSPSEIAA